MKMRNLYKFTGELRQLRRLKRLIKEGNKEDAMQLTKELYQIIKDRPLHFTVQARHSNNNDERSHIQAYRNIAIKNKNLALSDIQEVGQALLLHDNKRCFVLIDTLIVTRFHSKNSKDKIKAWMPTVNKNLTNIKITV